MQTSLWAVILGGSSGMGLATAKKLASEGYNIFIAHRDRKAAMTAINAEFDQIRQHPIQFAAINADALSEDGQQKIMEALQTAMGNEGKVKLLFHSIALGNLKPLAVPPNLSETDIGNTLLYQKEVLSHEDFNQTIYAMATSLVTWSQLLLNRQHFATRSRILGMTSEGGTRAWLGYAAVGAAKAALESIVRAMAVELAPHQITTNVLNAGVTDTPALRLIPGSDQMKSTAIQRNPFHRLTTPEDVANVVYLLCRPEADWINGSIIRVDGGEQIVG